MMGLKSKKSKIPVNLVAGFIIIAAICFAAGFVLKPCVTGNVAALTSEQAGQKAVDYINNYLLQPGVTANLINTSESNGVYSVVFNIASSDGSVVYTSYVTPDGKLLFTNSVNIEQTPQTAAQPETASSCEDIEKVESPVLDAFIVSYCPYGVQMQRVLVPVAGILENHFKVRYIGAIQDGKVTAMHGEQEATENLRQICIREEQADKYWDYITCFIKAGDTDGCLTSSGIDKSKLDTCMNDDGKGIEYASVDFGIQAQYGVTGSPTLILNGQKVSEFDFGGRSADAIKTLLCCGFVTEPGVCSQELNNAQAATSFSETYSGTGSTPSGSC